MQVIKIRVYQNFYQITWNLIDVKFFQDKEKTLPEFFWLLSSFFFYNKWKSAREIWKIEILLWNIFYKTKLKIVNFSYGELRLSW